MALKDLPTTERPRERLRKYGVSYLTNEELLCIIIRAGVKDMSVKDVSLSILQSITHINDLNDISINQLKSIRGVGETKAMSIIAALELGKRIFLSTDTNKIKANSTDRIYELFKNKFKFVTQEKLMAIFLNSKNQIIEDKTIFIGTVDSSTVHPREVFKEAFKLSAVAVIIIHNHPSGDPSPSKSDIIFTKKIEETGFIMSIPLIDHLIFGNNSYTSYYRDKWGENDEREY